LHRASTTSTAPQGEGDALDWAFGALGLQDRAKHIATLYLNDLADVIRDAIDPRFDSYATQNLWLQANRRSNQLQMALSAPHTLVDAFLHALTAPKRCRSINRIWCSSTAPFPGNVYGAFRIAQTINANSSVHRHGIGRPAIAIPSCAQ